MPTIDGLLAGGPLLWLLCLGSLLVGLSKGGLPGVGMLSVPLLTMVMSPVLAAVLLLPIYILSDLVGIWLYRRQYSAANLRILIPAGVLGVGIGWATASHLSDDWVALLIGLMGVLFCLDRWIRSNELSRAASPSTAKGLFWGMLSGFTSFISHAGSPPYQIYVLPQRLPKLVFAGTTTIVFAVVNLAKVIPYSSLHPYSSDTLLLSMALVPVAALGTYAGRWFIEHMPDKWFFTAVQLALFLICTKLLLSASFALFSPPAKLLAPG